MSETRKPGSRSAILLIHCPDRKGLVAKVTEFIYKNDGNIVYLEQHVDNEAKVFFMRVEWELVNFRIPPEEIGANFDTAIAAKMGMQWRLHFSDETLRVAVFVSTLPHCLYDLLSNCRMDEWRVEVGLVIGNHPELEPVARRFDIDFRLFPKTPQNRREQEREELTLLKKYDIDLVVLARYMQILSHEFVSHYPERIINIHHSFLPAFPGARPYHSAYERGVKVIGATSHYVTEELDAGPIIEQDVVRVSHQDSIQDMIRKGRELEKAVLSRALWHHMERKILVYNNRTVVFS